MWQYYAVSPIENEKNTKITAVCIVVIANVFNPAKFLNMLKLFMDLYSQDCSPIPVLQSYLSIFTSKESRTSLGEFKLSDYNDKKALISSVTSLVKLFQLEVIAIWVAMLLKKRIFVYGSNVRELVDTIRSFPLLGTWHRQNWNLLRPYVSSINAINEIKDLERAGVYVAGFTDEECANKTELYDLYVDLTNGKVNIPKHAKSSFTLTKFHKQIASKFVKAAHTAKDQELIKIIAVKTKELLDQLKTLSDENGQITMQSLSERNLPPNFDRFLYNLAVAEGIN